MTSYMSSSRIPEIELMVVLKIVLILLVPLYAFVLKGLKKI